MSDSSSYYRLCEMIGNAADSPGRGGNVSVKNEWVEVIKIKSSGQDLKCPNHETTICDLTGTVLSGNKPSMEIGFHLSIMSKYVIHYHPVYLLPWLCSNHDFDFGTTIDYHKPGEDLCEAISRADDTSGIILLKNHGVIIHGNTVEEIVKHHEFIRAKYFMNSDMNYSPDDCIDINNKDLIFNKFVMTMIANYYGLTMLPLTESQQLDLASDTNEKYRMGWMK